MANAPLIGITMRLEQETRRFYLGRDYCEAIRGAGGIPIHVPLMPEEAYIDDIVSRLDGVLLPGCDSDPDPALYGADPHPKLGTVVPEKDATDLMVIAAAEKRNMPIFGICFGMQILNVSRGGSLIQDIESQVDGATKHQQGTPRERKSHRIRIESGSLVENWSSSEQSSEIFVNSHHHQAIDRVGKGLSVTSRTSDGIAESVEDCNGHPVFAVQWHPELDWQNDPLSRRIFSDFVTKCSSKVLKVVP